MNDFTKEEFQNICPLCQKELEPESINIEEKAEECFLCYECGIISSPLSTYKVISHE